MICFLFLDPLQGHSTTKKHLFFMNQVVMVSFLKWDEHGGKIPLMKCLDWVWIPSSAWRGLGKDPRSSAGMSTRHLTYNFVTRRICFLQKEHHLCYCHPQQTMYTCLYIHIFIRMTTSLTSLDKRSQHPHTHTQSQSSFQQTYRYKPHRKGAKHVLGHVLPVWGFGFYEMVPGKAIHGSHVEWHDISS